MAHKGPMVICVINLKGGVGKSTICALLARHAFYRRRKNVLAIDLDPQANLSQAFMRYSYGSFLKNQGASIVEVFKGYLPPSPSKSHPSALCMDDVVRTVDRIDGRKLDIIPSRFDFADNLVNAAKPDATVLAKFIAGNFHEKDLILIDCAPTESILTQAAYHASSKVLIPVKPEFFATIGFPLLKESLRKFRLANKGQRINVAGVVINNAFYDGGNNGGPEKATALTDINMESNKNGWHIFQNEIPHSRGFPKLMRGDYSWSGNAWRFDLFANEFFNHLKI
jgi:chromosome partitioning protein